MELFSHYKPNQFKVPVFRHVKIFIKEQLDVDVSKPIVVDEHSIIGKMVLASLRENRKERAMEFNDKYRDRIVDEITIELNSYMMHLGPRMSKLMRINIDLDMWFKQSLLTFIEAQRITGIAEYTACRNFLQHYKIEEKAYSLDAAYKFYQRKEVFV
ncbi:MAG: hypothetical protein ACK5QX_07080 [bacterium]|jgi:hypothetical protein